MNDWRTFQMTRHIAAQFACEGEMAKAMKTIPRSTRDEPEECVVCTASDEVWWSTRPANFGEAHFSMAEDHL